MRELGRAHMGLINQMIRLRSKPTSEKAYLSQSLISGSPGDSIVDRGCRQIGLGFLAEALVDKDREEMINESVRNGSRVAGVWRGYCHGL